MRLIGVAGTLAASTLLLAACTGSSGGSQSGGGSGSGASGSSSGRASSAPDAVSPSRSAATSSAGGGSSASAATKPIATMVRQGLHATYTVRVWARESGADCATHAYGPDVPAYLRSHACRRVVRYLATTTANGRSVGISASTVTFGGATATAGQSAAGLAALLTVPAKGGIDDLFGDGQRLPGGPTALPKTVATNARNDGATVAVVDAWYLSGRTSSDDPGLTELLEAIT